LAPLRAALLARPHIPFIPPGQTGGSISFPGWSVGQQYFSWNSGVTTSVSDLIASPADGNIYYADGRLFPMKTPNGSTFALQYP
jgi:hypothetical protein